MTAATRPRRGLLARIAGLDDGAIIRTAFFVMLAGVAAVLWIDYRELSEANGTLAATPDMPVLPAFDPDAPATPNGPAVTTDQDALRQPLSVRLGSGGTLEVVGTIDIGSAERFRTELERVGEYVKTVALDSPGGSVTDALEMGRLIRDSGLVTSVASGSLCASSCPLVFAGGTERLATATSAIGVHQIYATVAADSLPVGLQAAGAAMSDAQKTTATITRYLGEAGIDPALWLHALETPPNRLYYLSAEELTQYRLATSLRQ